MVTLNRIVEMDIYIYNSDFRGLYCNVCVVFRMQYNRNVFQCSNRGSECG